MCLSMSSLKSWILIYCFQAQLCVSACMCVNCGPSAQPRASRCERCELDPLMNVFPHHVQVQSNYAFYAHLASPFTAPVCQAFRLNENIHRRNHAWHPPLTSCRNPAKHGSYAPRNLENLDAWTGELSSQCLHCYHTDRRVRETCSCRRNVKCQ